jgi:hypothetical protein
MMYDLWKEFELLPEDLESGKAKKTLKRAILGCPNRSKEVDKLIEVITAQFQAGAKRLVARLEIEDDSHHLMLFQPDNQSSYLGKRFMSASSLPIQTPPGLYLRRFAELFFPRKIYDHIFAPILRDLFDEYCEALDQKRFWKSRCVRVRGYWSFWSALFAQLPISTAKMVYKVWKATQ